MMKTLRIGTRGSPLAMAQVGLAAEAISAHQPDWAIEVVPLSTRGDRVAGPLAEVGGKGLFTAELEAALRSGELDLAVHSAKDMPAVSAEDLVIAAVPARGDARDAVVAPAGAIEHLPPRARVGTGSLRRAALLKEMRDDLETVPIRGNVRTRLARALGGGDTPADLDAVVLAMAALQRSGLGGTGGKFEKFIHPLPAETFIPAAGQGTLAIQAVAANTELIEALSPVNDAPSLCALTAERAVVRAMGAGCHSCLAVHVEQHSAGWLGRAMAARPDGSDLIRIETTLHTSADKTAHALIKALLARGADELIKSRP